MEETSQIICITCPKGCSLEVTHAGATVVKVNQGCKRGQEYVQRELSDPRRMVASTVRIQGGSHPLLPVYTAEPFPKPRIRRADGRPAQYRAARPGQPGAGSPGGRAGQRGGYPRQPVDARQPIDTCARRLSRNGGRIQPGEPPHATV